MQALEKKALELKLRLEADNVAEEPSCDRHWEMWMCVLQDVAADFFASNGKAPHKTPEYEQLMERRDLLLTEFAGVRQKHSTVGPLPDSMRPMHVGDRTEKLHRAEATTLTSKAGKCQLHEGTRANA